MFLEIKKIKYDETTPVKMKNLNLKRSYTLYLLRPVLVWNLFMNLYPSRLRRWDDNSNSKIVQRELDLICFLAYIESADSVLNFNLYLFEPEFELKKLFTYREFRL